MSTEKIALLGAPSNGAGWVWFMSKCDKETLRDVFLGIYATMLNTEMAQSSETLSSNGDAERKLRIFPKKFTADYEPKSIRINATLSLISLAMAVTVIQNLVKVRIPTSLLCSAIGVTLIQSMENALTDLKTRGLMKLQSIHLDNRKETGEVCF